MTQDATHAARDLLASLDPDALNPEQFNAWHALDAALRDGEATEGASAYAYIIDGECEEIGWGKPPMEDPSLVLLFPTPPAAPRQGIVECCAAVVESFIPLCGSEYGETDKLRKKALLRDVANAVRSATPPVAQTGTVGVSDAMVERARQIIANGIRPSLIHGKVMVAIADSVVRAALKAALSAPTVEEKAL